MQNSMLLSSQQQQIYDYILHCRLNGLISSDPYTLFTYHQRYDARFREQPKPSYSYIGLIAMAILSSPERKLVLSDIYQWISDHYPYFRSRGPGWRNSIRHNLSLNDCFIKTGRSVNGKGHYWSIHPANLADFLSGDFRRRRAQRRVRKSMGLTVPDDDGDDDDIEDITEHSILNSPPNKNSTIITSNLYQNYFHDTQQSTPPTLTNIQSKENPRKRCFDVDSLLAPDQPCLIKRQKSNFIYSPNSKSDISS